MKNSKLVLIALIIIIVLSACSKATIVATQTPVATTEQTAQYPAPQVVVTSNPAYPDPVTPLINTPGPTWTPDPQMGKVFGTLLITNNPVKNINLYLAEVIIDASGRDVVAGLDRITAPNSVTDDQGLFNFINVKAGRYALILDVVTNQYLMNYPGKEEPIIIEVVAGKEVDLGKLNYDTLPIP